MQRGVSASAKLDARFPELRRSPRSRPCSIPRPSTRSPRDRQSHRELAGKDIEKNVKAMLASSLARLDLVPRREFEVQAQVLLKTRAKLEALENVWPSSRNGFPRQRPNPAFRGGPSAVGVVRVLQCSKFVRRGVSPTYDRRDSTP
jgi:hypothetical protein